MQLYNSTLQRELFLTPSASTHIANYIAGDLLQREIDRLNQDLHFWNSNFIFFANVISTKEVEKGTGVSYGHEWHAKINTNIAILNIGYAFGIPRLSKSVRCEIPLRIECLQEGNGFCHLEKQIDCENCQFAYFIGRIAMNTTAIDCANATPQRGHRVRICGLGASNIQPFLKDTGLKPLDFLVGLSDFAKVFRLDIGEGIEVREGIQEDSLSACVSSNHSASGAKRQSPVLTPLELFDPNNVALCIDEEILATNYRLLQAKVHPGEIWCVLKSNAYGLGVKTVLPTLLHLKVRKFAPADAATAIELYECVNSQEQGYRFRSLIWSYDTISELADAVNFGAEVAISSLDDLRAVIEIGKRKPVLIHIFADTGLSREGFTMKDLIKLTPVLLDAYKSGYIKVTGLMTHLAEVSMAEDRIQLKKMQIFSKYLINLGFRNFILHAAASEAVCGMDTCIGDARIGAFLYGTSTPQNRRHCVEQENGHHPQRTEKHKAKTQETNAERVQNQILPAASLWSRITRIADGYAQMPIGRIHGLVDGYNGSPILINGKVRKITQINAYTCRVDARAGDFVGMKCCIFGREGRAAQTPAQIAQRAGTIPEELILRLNSRIQKLTG